MNSVLLCLPSQHRYSETCEANSLTVAML